MASPSSSGTVLCPAAASAVRLQRHLLLVLAALSCLRPTLSSSSADAPSGPILTFCSGQSPYFSSSPAVTNGDFDHFLADLRSGTTNLTDDMSYNLTSYYITENRTMSYNLTFVSASACAESAIWYDACFLRYSDQEDPSRFREDEYTATVFNTSTTTMAKNVDHWRAFVVGFLEAVRSSMVGSSRCSIGAGIAAGGSIYGFTRCAAGIACADCGRCLLGAVAVAEREYNGSKEMQVLRLSCMARYDDYPIYNDTSLKQLGVRRRWH